MGNSLRVECAWSLSVRSAGCACTVAYACLSRGANQTWVSSCKQYQQLHLLEWRNRRLADSPGRMDGERESLDHWPDRHRLDVDVCRGNRTLRPLHCHEWGNSFRY